MPVCARNENLVALEKLKKNLNIKKNQNIKVETSALVDIDSIINIIINARKRHYYVKKINYDKEISGKLPMLLQFEYVENVEIIYLYYRLLNCMVNNFNELFDNPSDINKLLEYCVSIKTIFKSRKTNNKIYTSVQNIEQMNNNNNKFIYKTQLNESKLENSKNCVGATNNKKGRWFRRVKCKINNKKNLSKHIENYEKKTKNNNVHRSNENYEQNLQKQKNKNNLQKLANLQKLEKNSSKKYNRFVTATTQRELDQGLLSKTNRLYIEGSSNQIYKFGKLVNKTTEINPNIIHKNKGFLMRESHYQALSPDQQKIFIDTVRSKKTLSSNQ